MKVFKRMTYKVHLTMQEATERNLDLPEELFDEDNDVYVLTYYTAMKYSIFTEAELALIYKECHNVKHYGSIDMKTAYPVTAQEVNDYMDHLLVEVGVDWLINRGTDIIRLVSNKFNDESRTFDQSMIEGIIIKRINRLQHTSYDLMTGTYLNYRSGLD